MGEMIRYGFVGAAALIIAVIIFSGEINFFGLMVAGVVGGIIGADAARHE